MTALITFLCALLAGLGVGSGGLFLVYLLGSLGMPQYAAQGTNLLFFCLATLSSTLLSLRAGRLSPGRLLPILPVGILGVLFGSLLTLAVPAEAARVGFGFFMLLGGLYTLFGRVLRAYTGNRRKKEGRGRQIP